MCGGGSNEEWGGGVAWARELARRGYQILATDGTAAVIESAGIPCSVVNKVGEGRPHIVDMIKDDQISLIINTTEGKKAIADSYTIRRTALQHKVTYTTTLAGGRATILALDYSNATKVRSLQELQLDTVA